MRLLSICCSPYSEVIRDVCIVPWFPGPPESPLIGYNSDTIGVVEKKRSRNRMPLYMDSLIWDTLNDPPNRERRGTLECRRLMS